MTTDNTEEIDNVAEISDRLSLSGECDECSVVQDCEAGSLFGAAQELDKGGWIVRDGQLLCYGCAEKEN